LTGLVRVGEGILRCVVGNMFDGVGSFCMGDGGLLDGGRRRFGGEDYWCSSPVWCGGNVHDTRHIQECMHATLGIQESQSLN